MLSLVTMIWGRRWNRVMGAALTVSLGLAGGLASVVWGGPSVLIGIIAALASAVIRDRMAGPRGGMAERRGPRPVQA